MMPGVCVHLMTQEDLQDTQGIALWEQELSSTQEDTTKLNFFVVLTLCSNMVLLFQGNKV